MNQILEILEEIKKAIYRIEFYEKMNKRMNTHVHDTDIESEMETIEYLKEQLNKPVFYRNR